MPLGAHTLMYGGTVLSYGAPRWIMAFNRRKSHVKVGNEEFIDYLDYFVAALCLEIVYSGVGAHDERLVMSIVGIRGGGVGGRFGGPYSFLPLVALVLATSCFESLYNLGIHALWAYHK